MAILLRPGTAADSYAVFTVFERSILDLGRRVGSMPITGGQDPETLTRLWETRWPLFEHLAQTAEHFWVAEDNGEIIGYARSVFHDGVRELTEYFLLPDHQSQGVGRALLERVFPTDGARHRTIVATMDTRAQARYLKLGIYPYFPTTYFSRSAENVTLETDLTIEPLNSTPDNLAALNAVDRAVLTFTREIHHQWLLTVRQGYLYRRGDEVVGYGYVGQSSGPFALLNAADFPAVLAHAERITLAQGRREFGVEVPMINRSAIGYLLSRGFQLDAFIALVMFDTVFGNFDQYIFTSPPFFL
jgi:ribosomal protein S18 acetylase RimI-like enzyme